MESGNFFRKVPGSKSFQFCGPQGLCFNSSTQLGAKAATGNMQMSGYGCIPIKLHLQKWVAYHRWPMVHNLRTFYLHKHKDAFVLHQQRLSTHWGPQHL